VIRHRPRFQGFCLRENPCSANEVGQKKRIDRRTAKACSLESNQPAFSQTDKNLIYASFFKLNIQLSNCQLLTDGILWTFLSSQSKNEKSYLQFSRHLE